MGTCIDTPSLLGNHCKTMNKMTLLPMFLLLSLASAEVEECGPPHCDLNCVSGQIRKDKKSVCQPTPAAGRNDTCCKGFSCTVAGKIVNDQEGKTKSVPGA